MYKSILAAAVLVASHATAAPTQNESSAASPLVPDYTPPSFVPTYDYSWCYANTSAVYIPPIFTYYPFAPEEVYKIVGSFVNITWVASFFNDTTYVGEDKVPGVIRTEPRDPFGAVEVLFNYATANTTHGFYHQQAAHLGQNITVAPGLLETYSHAVTQMMPACDGLGTSWGFYLTYCFDKAAQEATPGFDASEAEAKFTQAVVAGLGRSLQRLWGMLDGERKTPYNSTGSCEAMRQYHQEWETGSEVSLLNDQ